MNDKLKYKVPHIGWNSTFINITARLVTSLPTLLRLEAPNTPVQTCITYELHLLWALTAGVTYRCATFHSVTNRGYEV